MFAIQRFCVLILVASFYINVSNATFSRLFSFLSPRNRFRLNDRVFVFGGPRSRHYIPASPEDSYHPISDTVELVNAFNENPYNFDSVSEIPERDSYRPFSELSISPYRDTTPEYFENRVTKKPHVSGFGVNKESSTESYASTGMAELVDASFGEYVSSVKPNEVSVVTTQASIYPDNMVFETESSVNSEVSTHLPKENVSVSALNETLSVR